MRINKFIAQSGLCSRRKAEEFITDGLVKVNNEVVTNLATDIKGKDVVSVNNQVIKPSETLVYYMLYKPKGYVTTMSDDRSRKSVAELTSDLPYRVYPVGRLDYDSEGLLILTNDGDLTYKLTHPKFEIEKTYSVKIEGKILESELAVLRNGVVIDKVRYNKCKVTVKEKGADYTKLEVVLKEGKNREIRRMFDAIGKVVTFLKRVKVAELHLGGLKRGEKRALKDFEVEYLKNLTKDKTV